MSDSCEMLSGEMLTGDRNRAKCKGGGGAIIIIRQRISASKAER